jgi:hypothetical protein
MALLVFLITIRLLRWEASSTSRASFYRSDDIICARSDAIFIARNAHIWLASPRVFLIF